MATAKVKSNPYIALTMSYIIILQVNLLFFAKSRELTKLTSTSIELPVHTTGKELWASVISNFPR